MTWTLKKNIKSLLAREDGAVVKDWGGKISVALVYPNVYPVGMGNLAIHSIYKMLNDYPGIVCERVFLPSKGEARECLRTDTRLFSIETQRPLCDFDVAAFSISFENDYLNILPILDLSAIPRRAKERSDDHPILIAGGAAPTLNPKPIGAIFDAVMTGEAEMFLDELVSILASGNSRTNIISELGRMDGVFTEAADGRTTRLNRRHLENLNDSETQTCIYSSGAEFSNMHLIEVERGCIHRCKFCATPAIYGKPRSRSADSIIRMVDEGIKHRKKIGLIGAYILSHPDFLEIAGAIHAKGASFSPSSVRADEIDENRARLLARSGHQSVSLGIEAGSETLRKRLGKNISDAQIIDAVSILAAFEITKLKLYFMLGLPGETDEDIESIVTLSSRVRDTVQKHAPRVARQTSVNLTFSNFVPKPGAAFEGEKFAGEDVLRKKISILKKMIGKTRGLGAHFDSPSESAIESYLSNADESAIEFLEQARKRG